MSSNNSLSEYQEKAFNLRKELAKHCWDARSGNLDCFVANENTRDLVAMFPADSLQQADILQHKVMNQATKVYCKYTLTKKGLEHDDVKVGRVNTRQYLQAVKLPVNVIG